MGFSLNNKPIQEHALKTSLHLMLGRGTHTSITHWMRMGKVFVFYFPTNQMLINRELGRLVLLHPVALELMP